MSMSINLWQLMGFAITSLGGTLLHFLYDWLGESVWIAPFSGVNESTWEHMKLLFWPMFIFAIVQSRYMRNTECFWCIKLRGILLGLSLIPILFYTYNGAFGPSPDFVNISIFFISAAVSYWSENKLLQNEAFPCRNAFIPLTLLLLDAVLFVVFTFQTPEIPLFQDPLTMLYGIG